MWDLIVSVPDHCLSFYFTLKAIFHVESGMSYSLFQYAVVILITLEKLCQSKMNSSQVIYLSI